MSLHDWTTRRPMTWTEEDYLRAEVDAKEAAGVLDVSASRWRQITGSRAGTPDPIIGPGRTEPGRRGARWPLRRVLQYAMSTRRELPSPVPALLPHPDGQPRYSSTRAQAIRTAPPAIPTTAWADLYRPADRMLCGHPEPSVLLLTPTWPTTTWTMLPQLQPLLGAALASQTWDLDLELSTLKSLVIVIAPVDEGTYRPFAPTHLTTFHVTADGLRETRDLYVAAQSETSPSSWHLIASRTDTPVRDAASSLGHPIPWWRHGTATSSTCPRWAPGRPVTMTVPAGEAGRLEAAQWLQQPQVTHPLTQDGAAAMGAPLQEQARQLAAMTLPVGDLKDRLAQECELPDGLEVAAHVTRPASIDISDPVDPWPLLDLLLDDDRCAPHHVTKELHAYFGDPRYAPVAQIDLARLPTLWADLFLEARHSPTSIAASERWRRLQHAVADTSGTPTLFGPLDSPAVITDSSLTWLPPTGRHSTSSGAPALALPGAEENPHEVLLVRENIRGWIRGWVRTLNGRLIPLPARTQSDMGTHGDAVTLIAALNGQNPQELYDQSATAAIAHLDDTREGRPEQHHHDPIEDSSVIHLLRSVTEEPLTLTWAELQTIARLE